MAVKDNKKRCVYRTVFYIVIFKYTIHFYGIFCRYFANSRRMSYDRVHFLCSRLYTKQYMCGIKINNCKKMSKNWEKKVDRAVSLC